jgi:ribulose kinase
MELYADTTGCTVVAPPEDTDAVLLGTAMVAAASGRHKDLGAAASAMARPGTTHRPDSARPEAYDWRYRAFLEMQEQRRALDRLLGAGS